MTEVRNATYQELQWYIVCHQTFSIVRYTRTLYQISNIAGSTARGTGSVGLRHDGLWSCSSFCRPPLLRPRGSVGVLRHTGTVCYVYWQGFLVRVSGLIAARVCCKFCSTAVLQNSTTVFCFGPVSVGAHALNNSQHALVLNGLPQLLLRERAPVGPPTAPIVVHPQLVRLCT